MFKTVADEVWAFDAEWVPDPAAGRVLYGLADTWTDRMVVEEMWQRNGATDDDPMPYLKTILCRVVSMAYHEEQKHVRALITEKAQSPQYGHLVAYQEEWERLRACVRV